MTIRPGSEQPLKLTKEDALLYFGLIPCADDVGAQMREQIIELEAENERLRGQVAMLWEAAQGLIDGVKASRYTTHPCIICMIDLDHAPHSPGCAYVKAQETLTATADSANSNEGV